MPPLTRIICCANYRTRDAYNIAGIEPSTGAWVRPVSDLDDGRVARTVSLVGGRTPVLGDMIDIPLDSSGPDYGFEGENRSILQGQWQHRGSVKPEDLLFYCSTDHFILHNGEPYVTVQYLQSLPFEQRKTLQLVEAFGFDAHSTGLSAQGGHKWNGTFVSQSGERLTTSITDPVLIEKLESGYEPGAHCLVTVGLSTPFRREGWTGEGDPCWKLIAGVIELEKGLWRRSDRDVTAEGGRNGRPTSKAPVINQALVNETLKRVFGFDAFRPNQEEIIGALLGGRDCFAVMPTGGGKSLCYQLPAHLLPGTCLVISPLISLMKDQVDAAVGNGLRAACLTGAQTGRERVTVFQALEEGALDLLYVSPERFAMEQFVNSIKRAPLCMVAVDEAHCISEWGHDFRPDYLSLSELVKQLPHVPVAAFTATATHRVANDIVARLRLRDPFEVRASFNRPNLFYEVTAKTSVDRQILSFVTNRPGEAGIVYRTTRDGVEKTAAFLQDKGISALPYHAGLDPSARTANQDAFDRDEISVVVATIAFGMGIDKPNVRYVIHGDLPKNMEAYYQETGRAGRDGEASHCLLLFGRGDIPRLRYFIDQITDPTEQARTLASLNEVINYAGTSQVCRRTRILAYFGEEHPGGACTACDVCTGTTKRIDTTADSQKLLSAMVRTGERFGAVHIVDIVTGANTKKIHMFGHDRLPTYGVGKEHGKNYWRRLLDDLLALGIVVQSEGTHPGLRLGAEAHDVLKGTHAVKVTRREEPIVEPKRVKRGPAKTQHIVVTAEHGQDLFERLRALRRRLAAKRHVPPYVVFSDRSLHEMAQRRPQSEADLLDVHGVGEAKLGRYGEVFLREIAAHARDEVEVSLPG